MKAYVDTQERNGQVMSDELSIAFDKAVKYDELIASLAGLRNSAWASDDYVINVFVTALLKGDTETVHIAQKSAMQVKIANIVL